MDKKLTNHSARKVLVKKLKQAGLPKSEIITVTGHNHTSGLDAYDSGDEFEQRQISFKIDRVVPSVAPHQPIQTAQAHTQAIAIQPAQPIQPLQVIQPIQHLKTIRPTPQSTTSNVFNPISNSNLPTSSTVYNIPHYHHSNPFVADNLLNETPTQPESLFIPRSSQWNPSNPFLPLMNSPHLSQEQFNPFNPFNTVLENSPIASREQCISNPTRSHFNPFNPLHTVFENTTNTRVNVPVSSVQPVYNFYNCNVKITSAGDSNSNELLASSSSCVIRKRKRVRIYSSSEDSQE